MLQAHGECSCGNIYHLIIHYMRLNIFYLSQLLLGLEKEALNRDKTLREKRGWFFQCYIKK